MRSLTTESGRGSGPKTFSVQWRDAATPGGLEAASSPGSSAAPSTPDTVDTVDADTPCAAPADASPAWSDASAEDGGGLLEASASDVETMVAATVAVEAGRAEAEGGGGEMLARDAAAVKATITACAADAGGSPWLEARATSPVRVRGGGHEDSAPEVHASTGQTMEDLLEEKLAEARQKYASQLPPREAASKGGASRPGPAYGREGADARAGGSRRGRRAGGIFGRLPWWVVLVVVLLALGRVGYLLSRVTPSKVSRSLRMELA
jgi:hypothetical protein